MKTSIPRLLPTYVGTVHHNNITYMSDLLTLITLNKRCSRVTTCLICLPHRPHPQHHQGFEEPGAPADTPAFIAHPASKRITPECSPPLPPVNSPVMMSQTRAAPGSLATTSAFSPAAIGSNLLHQYPVTPKPLSDFPAPSLAPGTPR